MLPNKEDSSGSFKLSGSDMPVESIQRLIQDFIIKHQGAVIDNFELKIVLASDAETNINDIIDRHVAAFPYTNLHYDTRAEFIQQIINIYRRSTGKYVYLQDIWYQRNFNRFMINVIGCSYLLDRMVYPVTINDSFTTILCVKDYVFHQGDDCDVMVHKLNQYLKDKSGFKNKGVIPIDVFFDESVFVMANLLIHIDPANRAIYEKLVPVYPRGAVHQNQLGYRIEQGIMAVIPEINKYMAEIGCQFNFAESEEIPMYTDKLIYFGPERRM